MDGSRNPGSAGFQGRLGTLFLSWGGGAPREPSPVLTMDAATGKVLHTVNFKHYSYLHMGLAASADDRYLYVTNYDRRDITGVDLKDDYKLHFSICPSAASPLFGMGRLSHRRYAGWQETGRGTGPGRPIQRRGQRLSIHRGHCPGELQVAGQVKLNDEVDGFQLAISAHSKFAYLVTRPRKSPGRHALRNIAGVSLTRSARTLAFPPGWPSQRESPYPTS